MCPSRIVNQASSRRVSQLKLMTASIDPPPSFSQIVVIGFRKFGSDCRLLRSGSINDLVTVNNNCFLMTARVQTDHFLRKGCHYLESLTGPCPRVAQRPELIPDFARCYRGTARIQSSLPNENRFLLACHIVAWQTAKTQQWWDMWAGGQLLQTIASRILSRHYDSSRLTVNC